MGFKSYGERVGMWTLNEEHPTGVLCRLKRQNAHFLFLFTFTGRMINHLGESRNLKNGNII